MSEQDNQASDNLAALTREGEARLERLRSAQGESPGQPKEPEKPDTPVVASDALDAGDVTAGTDKGVEPTPLPVQTPDLSWLPESLHSKAEQIPSELLEEMRRSYLRQSDYTRKTQEAAKLVKSAEAVQSKADLWARLESNPEAARAAQEVLEGRKPKAPAADRDEDVDILTLTGPELKAWIRSEADRVAAQRAEEAAKQAAEATFHERLEKPKEALAAITSVLDVWAEENGLTRETAEEAIREGAARSKALGVTWTPENATELANIGLSFARAKPGKQSTARDEAGKFAKVASPVGRGSAAVSPRVDPVSVREKRPPQNDKERAELAAHVARESLGLNVTAEEIGALFNK